MDFLLLFSQHLIIIIEFEKHLFPFIGELNALCTKYYRQVVDHAMKKHKQEKTDDNVTNISNIIKENR